MTPKRLFFVMSGLVALGALLSIAGVVASSSVLTKKTSKLADLKLQNRVLEEQQLSITQAKKDIEKYAELERIAKQIVPQDKNQAQTVREIIKLAQDSGVGIASISFPSSNLGQAAAATAKPAESSTAAPKTTTSGISQVKPADGAPGVYQLEIIMQSAPDSTNFGQLLNFLKRLENNRRTSSVSNLNITPNSLNRSVLSFTMTINVYIKP